MAIVAGSAALVLLAFAGPDSARAADHQEAGTISGSDPAADIGDLYVWSADGQVRGALTFAGYRLRTELPVWDDEVLYQIHFDLDDDQVADRSIDLRFGQNEAGEWGYRVANLPGADAPLIAAVGETATDGNSRVVAGQFDDPFFFDLQGFQDTLATGDLSFNAERDFVAVKNTGALVFEFDVEALGATSFSLWATTGRL